MQLQHKMEDMLVHGGHACSKGSCLDMEVKDAEALMMITNNTPVGGSRGKKADLMQLFLAFYYKPHF